MENRNATIYIYWVDGRPELFDLDQALAENIHAGTYAVRDILSETGVAVEFDGADMEELDNFMRVLDENWLYYETELPLPTVK